jgi:molybdate transport system substrate-binding protein
MISLGLRRRALQWLALGTLGASLPALAQPIDTPTIAAASDLSFALTEAASAFRTETGRELRLTFGSSGNFARQLQQGAPFQLFLSADEGYVFMLADEGRTIDRGAPYAVGRIVFFVPHGSPLRIDDGLRDFRVALSDGRLRRFAIANPEHAPYGRAAEQALRAQGVWDSVKGRLVLGENVSQAAQFATTGSAEGGIFAYSLALSPAIATRGTYALLPQEWHAPLTQRMVLIKGAGATAQAFYRYMQEPAARALLGRYGFTLPQEG